MEYLLCLIVAVRILKALLPWAVGAFAAFLILALAAPLPGVLVLPVFVGIVVVAAKLLKEGFSGNKRPPSQRMMWRRWPRRSSWRYYNRRFR